MASRKSAHGYDSIDLMPFGNPFGAGALRPRYQLHLYPGAQLRLPPDPVFYITAGPVSLERGQVFPIHLELFHKPFFLDYSHKE